MSDYTVKSNLKHDGVDYAAGSTVELDEATAEGLLRDGVIADPNASADGDGERDEAQPAVNTTSREGDDVDGERKTEEGAGTETGDEGEGDEGTGEGAGEGDESGDGDGGEGDEGDGDNL